VGAAAALALAALALGAGDVRLSAGLHLEGRGRLVSTVAGPDERTLEATAVPRLGVEWFQPELRLDLGYAPRLRMPDLTRQADVTVLHALALGLATRIDRPWRFTASARGERGTTDLLTESRQAGAELQTITTTSRLRYRAARVDLGAAGRLDRRTELTLSAGAFAEGGEGARDEALHPLERGVRGEAGLSWIATRLDTLGLRLTALAARLERGPDSGVATLDASWRRRFTKTLAGWAGAGAAATYEDLRGAPVDRRLLPTGELGVSHTPPPPPATSEEEGAPRRETPVFRVSSEAKLVLSPVIDRATGAVDQQLEATLRALWPFMPRWTLGASAVGGVVRQPEGDARRGRLEAQATWAARAWARLGAGIYGSAQRSRAPALPSFDEGGIYVSLELDATPKPTPAGRP
jgi:hypothetical protein